MSMVNHLNAQALKENDSGITHFNPAKMRVIMITIPTMINMAVPTPFLFWFPSWVVEGLLRPVLSSRDR